MKLIVLVVPRFNSVTIKIVHGAGYRLAVFLVARAFLIPQLFANHIQFIAVIGISFVRVLIWM